MLLHAYLQGGAAADERNASWENAGENEATLLTEETILGWSATERKDAKEAVRTAGQQPSHVVFPLECDGPATALFDATSGSVAFKLRLFQQCSGMPLLQRMKVEFLYGSVGENGDSKEQRQQYASPSSCCASSPTPARTRAPTRLTQMLPPPPPSAIMHPEAHQIRTANQLVQTKAELVCGQEVRGAWPSRQRTAK